MSYSTKFMEGNFLEARDTLNILGRIKPKRDDAKEYQHKSKNKQTNSRWQAQNLTINITSFLFLKCITHATYV